MRKNMLYGAVFMLACIAGGAVVVAFQSYQAYDARINALNIQAASRLSLGVRILEIDLAGRKLTVEPLDSSLGIGKLVVRISEATRLERRQPIMENGIIAGLQPALPAETSELVVGKMVFVRATIEPDQTLSAYYILLDDPFSAAQ